MSEQIDGTPKVAAVNIRIKEFKNPKLQIYHNPLKERVATFDSIHRTIDRYEELSGFQWNGGHFLFLIWDDEDPKNAVMSWDPEGLDHPSMFPDYVKAIMQNATDTTENQ